MRRAGGGAMPVAVVSARLRHIISRPPYYIYVAPPFILVVRCSSCVICDGMVVMLRVCMCGLIRDADGASADDP